MRLPKVETIQGARLLIVWNGSKLELRANVPHLMQIAMLEGGLRIALDGFFRGGQPSTELGRLLGGGG